MAYPTQKAAKEAGLAYRNSSCPGLSRVSTSFGVGRKKDVDGRDKATTKMNRTNQAGLMISVDRDRPNLWRTYQIRCE
jgi:hypothetical protein